MAWHICTCHPQWHWVWLNPMSIPAPSVGKLYYKLISITREFLDTQSSISYCGLLHPVQLSNIYDDHTWPNKNRMAFCQSFFMIRETKIVYRYISGSITKVSFSHTHIILIQSLFMWMECIECELAMHIMVISACGIPVTRFLTLVLITLGIFNTWQWWIKSLLRKIKLLQYLEPKFVLVKLEKFALTVETAREGLSVLGVKTKFS